jgi:hypothetical protein
MEKYAIPLAAAINRASFTMGITILLLPQESKDNSNTSLESCPYTKYLVVFTVLSVAMGHPAWVLAALFKKHGSNVIINWCTTLFEQLGV